jgi:hypothetical protein
MGLHKGHKKVKFTNFLMLGRDMVLHCDEWKQLSPRAIKLYLCIKAKHNGRNNGDICLHYSELETVKGLSSPSTVSKAFRELEKKGWIERIGLGGLYRIPNKYGLTGKYDDYISDKSHTVPEKYKEPTYSGVQKQPPVGYDSLGLKICQPQTPSSSPAQTPDIVASGTNSRS